MIKSKILHKLNLDKLIKSGFEDLMDIIILKKGETIYYNQIEEMTAIYVLEGNIQYIVCNPIGGEFYVDHFSGELLGIGANLSKLLKNSAKQNFDVDLIGKEDSIIVTLPFDRIFYMNLNEKEEILKQLILLFIEEHSRVSKYFLHKSLSSDEDFLISFLERHGTLYKTTRELSEILNTKLRTLQRIIKKLQEAKVIIKSDTSISIGEKDVVERYKRENKI